MKKYLFFSQLLGIILPGYLYSQSFTRVTSGAVVTTNGDSRSVNWVDVNNDGWVDLYISNGPSGGQNNMLYLNDGLGGFTQVTSDTLVKDKQPSDGSTWADSDNDGDIDCFTVNWYNTANMFYTNSGTGVFTKMSNAVNTSGGYCETAAWGDYDNDGLVDLYVTNSAGSNRNLLYHNNGNNSFTRITSGAAVADVTDSRSVNWTDIDNDGDVDLFVTNESNQNEFVFRNDGSGTFVKLTSGVLLNDGANTMSSSWGDYDNDGDLDVFLANDAGSNALYRNDGGFTFVKVVEDTVSKTNNHSFGSAWSDIDNDGDLDLFVTNSFYTSSLQHNFLYVNNGGSFTRVDSVAPAIDKDWSYGCAFADYDNDGFEDLAVATCRFNGADRPDLLYHNNGNSNNWITLKLTGKQANRSAIGTKVRIKAVINAQEIWQMREISAQSGYCGQNDLRVHFGLGNATLVDSIIVEWLGGSPQVFTHLSVNQFMELEQGATPQTNGKKWERGELKIYPNPAQGDIIFSLPETVQGRSKTINIYNANGKLVAKTEVPVGAKEVKHIQLLPNGTYTAEVLFRNKWYVGNFVVNN